MQTTMEWEKVRVGVVALRVMVVGVFAVGLSGGAASAQCGVGGNFSGQCVNLEFRPTLQTAFVGEIVDLSVFAVSVNLFDQPLQGLDILLTWDPSKLELRGHKTCKGGANDGMPCVSSTECGSGVFCSLDCEAGETPNCYVCPADAAAGTPVSYNWVSATYPNDAALDGLNADCGPGIFCNPYTGRPFNDGEARFTALKQIFCAGGQAPAPPAPPEGLLIATFRFRVLASGPTQVAFKASADCQTRQRTCDTTFSANPGTNCTVDSDCGPRVCIGGTNDALPCTSNIQCSPDGLCPVLCKACETQQCCTTETNCSVCSFADTRVIGGTQFGIVVTGSLGSPAQIDVSSCQTPTVTAIGPRYLAVTPAAGPASVALKVTGVEADVACVSGWAQSNGAVAAVPFFQSPAAWGTVSVRGADLASSRTFQVQTDCDPANPGVSLSAPSSATLWARGDADNNRVVDINDIVRIIDGFRSVLDSLTPCTTDAQCSTVGPNFSCNLITGFCVRIRRENVDLVGGIGCLPEQIIDVLDIAEDVDAFRGALNRCSPSCVP